MSPFRLPRPQGTLPTLNAKVVEKAVTTGLSLGCEIALLSRFDRKQYFYADLPKGYQITQQNVPIASRGTISYVLPETGEERTLGITRVHMEEDAGASRRGGTGAEERKSAKRAGDGKRRRGGGRAEPNPSAEAARSLVCGRRSAAGGGTEPAGESTRLRTTRDARADAKARAKSGRWMHQGTKGKLGWARRG